MYTFVKGRFDAISKKEKENSKILKEIQKNQKKQEEAIEAINAAVDASALEEILPENLGLPFKTIEEIDSALKDKNLRRKLFQFASRIEKTEYFATQLHDQMLDKSLIQVCFTSPTG